jgi:hypothetical protein
VIDTFIGSQTTVKVERRTARSAETRRYLLRENEVDVFVTSSDDGTFADLYEQGAALSLTPFIQQGDEIDRDDFIRGR